MFDRQFQFQFKINVRNVVVQVKERINLQEVKDSECNVFWSHRGMTVCVYVCVWDHLCEELSFQACFPSHDLFRLQDEIGLRQEAENNLNTFRQVINSVLSCCQS